MTTGTTTQQPIRSTMAPTECLFHGGFVTLLTGLVWHFLAGQHRRQRFFTHLPTLCHSGQLSKFGMSSQPNRPRKSDRMPSGVAMAATGTRAFVT